MNKIKSVFKGALKFIFAASCIITASSFYPSDLKAQSTAVTKITFQKDKYNRIFIPVKIDRDSMSLLFGTYSKPLRLTPYFQSTRLFLPVIAC